MTEPQTPYPPREPSSQPVDYAGPTGSQPAGNVPFGAQAAIGFGITMIVMVITGLAYLTLNRTSDFLGVSLYLLVPAGLIALAIAAWIFWRWRGLLAGVLSAFAALVLLAVGAYLLLLAMCSGKFG